METTQQRPLEAANIDAMFLVWSAAQGAHRSAYFASTLGMRFRRVYFTQRRGAFYAALKYPVQTIQTIILLMRERPKLVFVQDPPTPAALVVWFCGLFLGLHFIVDTHTQRQLLVDYRFLSGMRRFVARRALTNIVTNAYLKQLLQGWGAPALVMEDPPLNIADEIVPDTLSGDFNVVWVNVAAVDEPRDVVLEAAEKRPYITFYVTSDYDRTADLRAYKQCAPQNMIFTGYLGNMDYYRLLKSANAVMTLTTWNYTLQQGACEAMWLGRPVITSDWPILRSYFSQGALFVDNSSGSLIDALDEMQANHARYVEEIKGLTELRSATWAAQVDDLMKQIHHRI